MTPAPQAVDDAADDTAIDIRNLSIRYGAVEALRPTTLRIARGTIHGIIGPAGSGKSSLLRTLNRLSVERDGATASGSIRIDGTDVLALRGDALAAFRRGIGFVFATPQPLPRTIFENVAFAPRMAGIRDQAALAAMVERALRTAQLWEEVADRLDLMATQLSGGQQQRLCIARALALTPGVILLDEPCSALDPITTYRIEQTLLRLTPGVTVVLVTNNVHQAERIAHDTSFILSGDLVETAPTARLFSAPSDTRTRDYLAGRFG
ncbi:MAG: ATP-binding cassette domain-containing protein [Gemmatimonadaceae bacterium]|nr:ATP-binding cassette domain-containing protein [Gemmatimonadaceae bacterium]